MSSFRYNSTTFKLYYESKLIGTITKTGTDQPWFLGGIAVTEAIEEYRERFVKEFHEFGGGKEANEEPPMSIAEGSFIEDDEGNRKPASLLVIRGDDVAWSM